MPRAQAIILVRIVFWLTRRLFFDVSATSQKSKLWPAEPGIFVKCSCGGATPAAAPTGKSGSDEVAVIPVELSERTYSHTPPDVEEPVVSEQPEHEEHSAQ